MNKYRIYGLKVLSEFKLNELGEINDDDFDVVIKKGEVKFDFQQSKKLFQDTYFVKNKNSFQLSVDGIADYEINNGNEILIDIKKNSDLNEFKIFLYGTCMTALLLQRKIICLHGAGIVRNDEANLFLGYSGIGKSTLTSYFVNQGYQFLGDDVLPLRFGDNRQVMIGYSVPTVKIWEDNLVNLGIKTALNCSCSCLPKFSNGFCCTPILLICGEPIVSINAVAANITVTKKIPCNLIQLCSTGPSNIAKIKTLPIIIPTIPIALILTFSLVASATLANTTHPIAPQPCMILPKITP